ncbi:alpha-L-fucosidase [Rapidithrix thailandica]|uniref:alpha-L-fucosidase n=1 Tax=Rapidithrix thailandica TaxID=413964 RepID=A0AAW9S996_9BACT
MKKIVVLLFVLSLACTPNEQYKPPKKLYEPTLKSIRAHQSPEWFDDAKFGMFIDYGIYSVPGWAHQREDDGPMYPDWYLHDMYRKEEWIDYHKKAWGEDFHRDDFIPMFTAENFDPEGLVQLAEKAGMKYVVPFCKHHDGFCLWPSSFTERDAKDMGPKKDLIKPIVEACKKRGLKFGFYFSLEEWEYPVIQNGESMVRIWENKGVPPIYVPFDEKEMEGKISGKKPVDNFFSDYIIPQANEFIDLYDPDLIWFDGEWDTPIEDMKTPEIVSYYYNQAAGRKEVAVNDRMGKGVRFRVGDFFSSEYHSLESNQPKIVHKWEEIRGISQSYGYNWQDTDENVLSMDEFIEMFVKIVSENGNLLLIVNLDGKGALPDYQRTRLEEIGEWLKINGEAIYKTKPWLVSHEGDNLRFTQSKDEKYVYVICNEWPGRQVIIESVFLGTESKINMLGSDTPLQWSYDGKKVIVEIPESLENQKPCNYAYVLKIELS